MRFLKSFYALELDNTLQGKTLSPFMLMENLCIMKYPLNSLKCGSKGMAPYTAGLLTKILRIPAKTLRAGAILNPQFMQKNVSVIHGEAGSSLNMESL